MRKAELRPSQFVGEQLSMFGIKPTARMTQGNMGQLMIDILEITEPPKEFINYDRNA